MGITFKEIGDDCSICPIGKAGLCHGLVNYGNGPVYPPCSELDENTDAEKYIKDREIAARRREEQRKEKQKADAEKKKKKELQKKRRQFSDSYCHKEIDRVNDLKKLLSKIEKATDSTKIDLIFAESAIQCGLPTTEPEQLQGNINQLNEKSEKVKAALEEAKKQLAAKRSEVQKTKQYKNIV